MTAFIPHLPAFGCRGRGLPAFGVKTPIPFTACKNYSLYFLENVNFTCRYVAEVTETTVRSKRKKQTKELERCRAIYGEENAVTIDRTVKWISPFAIGKDGNQYIWHMNSIVFPTLMQSCLYKLKSIVH